MKAASDILARIREGVEREIGPDVALWKSAELLSLRREEIGSIVSAVESSDGAGGEAIVLMTGTPGCGKTHLLRYLVNSWPSILAEVREKGDSRGKGDGGDSAARKFVYENCGYASGDVSAVLVRGICGALGVEGTSLRDLLPALGYKEDGEAWEPPRRPLPGGRVTVVLDEADLGFSASGKKLANTISTLRPAVSFILACNDLTGRTKAMLPEAEGAPALVEVPVPPHPREGVRGIVDSLLREDTEGVFPRNVRDYLARRVSTELGGDLRPLCSALLRCVDELQKQLAESAPRALALVGAGAAAEAGGGAENGGGKPGKPLATSEFQGAVSVPVCRLSLLAPILDSLHGDAGKLPELSFGQAEIVSAFLARLAAVKRGRAKEIIFEGLFGGEAPDAQEPMTKMLPAPPKKRGRPRKDEGRQDPEALSAKAALSASALARLMRERSVTGPLASTSGCSSACQRLVLLGVLRELSGPPAGLESKPGAKKPSAAKKRRGAEASGQREGPVYALVAKYSEDALRSIVERGRASIDKLEL